MSGLHQFRSNRIGLALSGGSVRGLAHIGVVKVLSEIGIRSAVITGTSAGSLIGAMLAGGMDWREIASLARKTFWPKLLHGEMLERFCAEHLPATFADLRLPFAATATELPGKRTVMITTGDLASAISASCALRGIRRPVRREGKRLKDGVLRAFYHRKPAGPWVRTSSSVPMFGNSARYCVGSALVLITPVRVVLTLRITARLFVTPICSSTPAFPLPVISLVRRRSSE